MDFGIRKGVRNFWQFKNLGASINQRLLETQRVADDCALATAELDLLHRPTRYDGHRVPALRFGDPRVMALLAALCQYRLLPNGFRNRATCDIRSKPSSDRCAAPARCPTTCDDSGAVD